MAIILNQNGAPRLFIRTPLHAILLDGKHISLASSMPPREGQVAVRVIFGKSYKPYRRYSISQLLTENNWATPVEIKQNPEKYGRTPIEQIEIMDGEKPEYGLTYGAYVPACDWKTANDLKEFFAPNLVLEKLQNLLSHLSGLSSMGEPQLTSNIHVQMDYTIATFEVRIGNFLYGGKANGPTKVVQIEYQSALEAEREWCSGHGGLLDSNDYSVMANTLGQALIGANGLRIFNHIASIPCFQALAVKKE